MYLSTETRSSVYICWVSEWMKWFNIVCFQYVEKRNYHFLGIYFALYLLPGILQTLYYLLTLNTILCDDDNIYHLLNTYNVLGPVLYVLKHCLTAAFIFPLFQKAKLRCRQDPLTNIYTQLSEVTKLDSPAAPTPLPVHMLTMPCLRLYLLSLTLQDCSGPFHILLRDQLMLRESWTQRGPELERIWEIS